MFTRSFRLAGCALAGSLLSVSVVTAQEADPILVTATRTAQIADEALAPVIVITREEIERTQAVDLPELLRLHAGLDIGRNGGPGQAASLFIRGTESNHTLVMIDGVRINPGTIGGAAIHNINPGMIERVEIVKGPRSALYGSEAVGGVINIITRTGADGTRSHAGATAGSFSTSEITAGTRHHREGRRWGIEVASLDTDGFPTTTGSGLDRGHENDSVNAYAGARLRGLDLEASHFRTTGTTEYIDFLLNPRDQDFENSVSAVTLRADPLANWTTRVRLSRARDELEQNQGPDFARTERDALDWQNDIQIGMAQLLTAGLWLAREETATLSFGTGFDEDVDINAFYLQDDIDLGAHRLLLAARYSDHDAFGGHTTWDLEYGYRVSADTRVSAALGTAFRAPDSTDRFGFGGDPDLDPEESRNVELGLRHRLAAHQDLAVNVFDNRIENLIEFDFGTSQMVNIGRARIRGVEATYELGTARWDARVAAIIQDPENEITGNQLPRRAKRGLTASLNFTPGRYELGGDLVVAGRRRDSDFSNVRMGGYGVVNLTAGVRLAPGWRLRGRVENLFDKAYELADGFNTAERSYFAEIAYTHGGDR